MATTQLKSYSSLHLGLLGRLGEFWNLYRRQTYHIRDQVRTLIERVRGAEREVQALSGMRFKSLRILEIGPGQKFRQMSVYSRFNDVTGIDLDELAQTYSIGTYWRMLRANGPIRVIKTLGRRTLGIDGAFERELTRQLGSPRPKTLDLRRMDVAKLEFEPATFDLVYSFSVFEHIPAEAIAKGLGEIVRVLRPGGVVYISLHLFTSDDGCHDPAVFANRRAHLPLWSHLRPKYAPLVKPNSYLNRLRLADWDALVQTHLPGATIRHNQYAGARLKPEAAKIRAHGELTDYSDDELLTTDYIIVWQKPK